MRTRLTGARIVLANEVVEDGSLTMEDGRIVEIGGTGLQGDIEISLHGALLLPGLVDLHGDAIEKEVEPRPNAFFPLPVALVSIDRRLIASGITTAFHGLSFAHGELGVRDIAVAERVARALRAYAPRGQADNRIHIRYEITDPKSFTAVKSLVVEGIASLLSFMDHTPGQGQFKDVASYKAYFGKTYHTDDQAIDTLIDAKEKEAANALTRMEELARHARQHGVAIAGHDDEGAERIALMIRLGATISEFPCDLATARDAYAKGLATLFGAPNVLRGRSLSGALSARDAIASGVATGLCSDYAPQALLPAVGVLVSELGLSWPEAVSLVSAKPARAAGLVDRGEIAVGKAADLIVVGDIDGTLVADAVWRKGHMVYSAGQVPRSVRT